jgi:hypothetical protein
MSEQIIKQPNGKYCIFSSVVDSVTKYNATEEEIIADYVKDYGEKARADIKYVFKQIESGKKPYHQFTLTYEKMLDIIQRVHDSYIMEATKKRIESYE